jgi:hypothetical protein
VPEERGWAFELRRAAQQRHNARSVDFLLCRNL